MEDTETCGRCISSAANGILHSPFAQEQDLLTDKAGLLTDCAKQVLQMRLLKQSVQWLMHLLDTKHSNGCCTEISSASLFARGFPGTLYAYGMIAFIIARMGRCVN